jgi:hypothetical protein
MTRTDGHWQCLAADPRTDLAPSWQVKSFHHGKSLLAHVQGWRTPSGLGSGLGPDRIGCTERTAAAAHNPRHQTDSHPRRFLVQDGQTKRSDLTARNTERGRPFPRLGQPASGLETGQHRSTARRHQVRTGSASQLQPGTPRAGRTHQPNPSRWPGAGAQRDATHSDKPIDGPPAGNLQKFATSGILCHVKFILETLRI